VLLPNTGELPPLSGGPSIYAIFAAGLGAGLILGLGLRKRLNSWFVRLLGVFVLLALVGLPAYRGWLPVHSQVVGGDRGASQEVRPF
jgi:hypothetical protein